MDKYSLKSTAAAAPCKSALRLAMGKASEQCLNRRKPWPLKVRVMILTSCNYTQSGLDRALSLRCKIMLQLLVGLLCCLQSLLCIQH